MSEDRHTCVYCDKCDHFNKKDCHGNAVFICSDFNTYLKKDVNTPRNDIELGLLQMQVLWLLSIKSSYGYELMKNLNEVKRSKITQGTLYPTLQRLEEMQLIEAKQDGRKIMYHLTEKGKVVMKENCTDFCRTFYGIFKNFMGEI